MDRGADVLAMGVQCNELGAFPQQQRRSHECTVRANSLDSEGDGRIGLAQSRTELPRRIARTGRPYLDTDGDAAEFAWAS
jgi:hypothetical protein